MDLDFFRHSIESALAPLVPDGAVRGLVSEPPPPKVDRGGGSGKARRSSGQRVKLADLSVPCFRLTRAFEGMKPPAIAVHLLTGLAGPPAGFSDVVANGPYLNFFYDPAVLAEKVLEGEIEPAADTGLTILVEYSSPNIAKPFHIGHLRTTILGECLARMLEHQGHTVVRINHLGDWGVQTGFQILAWRRWGRDAELERGGIRYLCDLYVRINAEAEDDPSLADQARALFRSLEEGDASVREDWRRFVDITLEELGRSYGRLGVGFDRYDGESSYETMIPGVLEELDESGMLYESEGARVVDVEGLEEPCILVKSDGATIYQTRDVAAALFRWKTWPGFSRCLYVVAANQEFHFRQVFGVFDRMRPDGAGRLRHVKFGMVRDAAGDIFSTRGGASARLDDILDEARDRALDLVREKSGPLQDEMAVAEAVGCAALAYEFLRRSPNRDLRFVFEEASRPDGDTGPYLQYTHARCCSIINECGGMPAGPWDPSLLDGPEEVEVLKALLRLPSAVGRSADHGSDAYDTSTFTSALMELARSFGSFYTASGDAGSGQRYRYPVRDAGPELRASRLRLVDSVRRALAWGLHLLTIQAPERM
ncbi:MAG: arginine--tRNA ligase [Deltaproteobacteria bacterium]|nr:arginine--tRNA ligase [Deltaproteobacteria bacterium]